MPYEVEVLEDPKRWDRCFYVKVNGWTLTDKKSRPRYFSTSITAAVAAAKHIDVLKRMAGTAARTSDG